MTGRDLVAALAALGLTQEQFAERVGRSRLTVNRWVNGGLPVPGWVTLALDGNTVKFVNREKFDALVEELTDANVELHAARAEIERLRKKLTDG